MQRRARENGAWIRVAFIKKYAGTVLGAALLLALAVFGITYRNEIWAVLTQQDARDAFIAFVHDSGFWAFWHFWACRCCRWWWPCCPANRWS